MASAIAEEQANWDYSLAECETYCRFYIHISKEFNLSLHHDEPIKAAQALALAKQYIDWVHPPTPQHKEAVQIPIVPADVLEETHKYFLKWTYALLQPKLRVHPLTGDAVPAADIVLPTKTEVTRVAQAFYQIFIYFQFLGADLVDIESESVLNERVPDIRMLHGYIATSVVEAQGETAIYILLDSVLFFLERMINTRRSSRRRWWYTANVLSPKSLWEHVFESPEKEPLQEFWPPETAPPRSHPVGPIYTARGAYSTNRRSYSEFRRICKDELVVAEGDYLWWNHTDELESREDVDIQALVWDDWRLERWGYHFPMIKLPLYLEGHPPLKPFRGDISTPIVHYKETGKSHKYISALYPELNGTGWTKPDEKCVKETALVADILGLIAPPPLTPTSLYPPVEVQNMILQYTDTSEYRTLRAVCKSWKAETWKILKSKYVEPDRPDQKALAEIPDLRGAGWAQASPEESPFLIHPAILEFTGYVRGRRDTSCNPPTMELGKIYTKPDPDDPLILSTTKTLRRAVNDPIVIPNTDTPKPLSHNIYLSVDFFSPGFRLTKGQELLIAAAGHTLQVHRIYTVGQYLALHYTFEMEAKKLRSLPPWGVELSRCSHLVSKTPFILPCGARNRIRDGNVNLGRDYINLVFCLPFY